MEKNRYGRLSEHKLAELLNCYIDTKEALGSSIRILSNTAVCIEYGTQPRTDYMI